jgi:hypothetical protein
MRAKIKWKPPLGPASLPLLEDSFQLSRMNVLKEQDQQKDREPEENVPDTP